MSASRRSARGLPTFTPPSRNSFAALEFNGYREATMMRNRMVIALAMALSLAAFPGIQAAGKKKNTEEARQFLKQIPDDQKILQALNRLTFGPRPGDAQDVKAMGLKKW